MSSFAVTWTASGIGPGATGLVAVLGVAPRALLVLLGGAAGDRVGVRRVMVCCDSIMLVTTATLAAVVWHSTAGIGVLAGVAVITSVVTAFYSPASGVFPRLFVPDEQLPRALAVVSSGMQLARVVGPAVGGILVAQLALRGAAAVNAVSFLLVLLVLVRVVPPREESTPRAAGSGLRSIVDGLRAARRAPGIPVLLAGVALLAGGVLPALYLCIPLAARERGWTAGQVGIIEACWIVGSLLVTLLVAVKGTLSNTRAALIVGPLLTTVGVGVLAVSPVQWSAMLGTAVTGVGVGIFTAHAFPVFLARSRSDMQTRFQSLLSVVQAVPLLAFNALYAAIAARSSTTWALLLAAAIAGAASVVMLRFTDHPTTT